VIFLWRAVVGESGAVLRRHGRGPLARLPVPDQAPGHHAIRAGQAHAGRARARARPPGRAGRPYPAADAGPAAGSGRDRDRERGEAAAAQRHAGRVGRGPALVEGPRPVPREIPAATRFVSAGPLIHELGPVDLSGIGYGHLRRRERPGPPGTWTWTGPGTCATSAGSSAPPPSPRREQCGSTGRCRTRLQGGDDDGKLGRWISCGGRRRP
jgi:hypothetical protein